MASLRILNGFETLGISVQQINKLAAELLDAQLLQEDTMPSLSQFLSPSSEKYCYHPEGPLYRRPRWKRRLRDHSVRVKRCGRKGMKR